MDFSKEQISRLNKFMPKNYKITAMPIRRAVGEVQELTVTSSIGKRIPKEKKFFEYTSEEPQEGRVFKKALHIIQLLRAHRKFNMLMQKKRNELTQIEENLKNSCYQNASEFGDDIRKMFITCYRKNAKNPDMYSAAIEMSQFFEIKFRSIDNLAFSYRKSDSIYSLRKKVEQLNTKIEDLKKGPKPKSPRKRSRSRSNAGLSNRRIKNLVTRIESLPSDNYQGSSQIAKLQKQPDLETKLASMPQKALKELERYVSQCSKQAKNVTPQNPTSAEFEAQQSSENDLQIHYDSDDQGFDDDFGQNASIDHHFPDIDMTQELDELV